MIKGVFEIKDKDLAGRLGIITTKSGLIRTPTLLPVVNPRRQELPVREIVEVGFEAIITNAYLLKRYREREVLEVGVHKLLGFEGPIMTDSGAYQILQYGDVEVSNKEIVEFQELISSDIAVILDVPTGGYATRVEAEKTVLETLSRAREAVEYRSDKDILWVLPIQGGTYLDLLEKSVREGIKLPYHIIAIGSPTQLMEKYDFETIIDMIVTVKKVAPQDIPVHLFGAGHPMMLSFAVALGVDLFDSAAYAIYAKDERYLTSSGTYRLEELEEFPCTCPVCSKHTVDELRRESRRDKVKLLSKHNLYAIVGELRRIRQALKEGTLWELLEERSRAHPSLHRAFRRMCRYKDYLEALDPEVKGRVHGLLLYDELSLCRPEIIRHKRRLLKRFERSKGYSEALVLVGLKEKPYTRSREYVELRGKFEKTHILFYNPYLSIIPEELAETFPNSQFEEGSYNEAVIRDSLEFLVEFLKAQKYDRVTIAYTKTSRDIARKIRDRILRNTSIKCETVMLDRLVESSTCNV